jgi:hypothetical protein
MCSWSSGTSRRCTMHRVARPGRRRSRGAANDRSGTDGARPARFAPSLSPTLTWTSRTWHRLRRSSGTAHQPQDQQVHLQDRLHHHRPASPGCITAGYRLTRSLTLEASMPCTTSEPPRSARTLQRSEPAADLRTWPRCATSRSAPFPPPGTAASLLARERFPTHPSPTTGPDRPALTSNTT